MLPLRATITVANGRMIKITVKLCSEAELNLRCRLITNYYQIYSDP